MQIIYSSRPVGFDDHVVQDILAQARIFNARDGITGALVCREDVFLQCLEGTPDAIARAYDRISRDCRHTDIKKRAQRSIARRTFGDWSMLHKSAISWLWTTDDIAAGMLETTSEDELWDVFEGLSVFARADSL